MYKKGIGITTDCICDLPLGILEEYNIDMIYFHVATENGLFLDREEITADNVFEHMDNGGLRAEAQDPTVQEYKEFFEEKLKEYETIIHVSVSSKVGKAYSRAGQALEKLGNAGHRVKLFDSMQISTGIGLLALRAAEMRKAGMEASNIFKELEIARKKVSVSFMLTDALYLYLNDKVKLRTVKWVSLFKIRPVLKVKDGCVKVSKIYIGNYAGCTRRYVKSVLKKIDSIDKTRIFITNSKCNLTALALAKKEVKYRGEFKQVIINKTSGSLASEIGPNSFGILFIRK